MFRVHCAVLNEQPDQFWLTCSQSYGGHGERETPGHIPNPEAKPLSADGTALETGWESRTPPDNHSRRGPSIRAGAPSSYPKPLLLVPKAGEWADLRRRKSASPAVSGGQRRARGSFAVAPTLSASQVLSAARSRHASRTSSSARRVCSHSAGSHRRRACRDLCLSSSIRGASAAWPAGTRVRRSPSIDQPAPTRRCTSCSSWGPWTSSATARRYRATWSDSRCQLPPATMSPSAETWTYQAPVLEPSAWITAPWWVL